MDPRSSELLHVMHHTQKALRDCDCLKTDSSNQECSALTAQDVDMQESQQDAKAQPAVPSGWLSGKAPSPMRVWATGMPVRATRSLSFVRAVQAAAAHVQDWPPGAHEWHPLWAGSPAMTIVPLRAALKTSAQRQCAEGDNHITAASSQPGADKMSHHVRLSICIHFHTVCGTMGSPVQACRITSTMVPAWSPTNPGYLMQHLQSLTTHHARTGAGVQEKELHPVRCWPVLCRYSDSPLWMASVAGAACSPRWPWAHPSLGRPAAAAHPSGHL